MTIRLKYMLSAMKRHLGTALQYFHVAIRQPELFRAAAARMFMTRSRYGQGVNLANNIVFDRRGWSNEPLSIDALFTKLASQMGIVIITRREGIVHIGVADFQMISAVNYLDQAVGDGKIFIDNSIIILGIRGVYKRIMSASEVSIHFKSALQEPIVIVLEFYLRHEAGRWVSQNMRNSTLRAIHSDLLEKPGLSLATDILGGCTLEENNTMYSIDVVYTWVNHNDLHWKKLYFDFKSKESSKDVDIGASKLSGDADALTRFHSNDELKYSLRSIARHMPWVRKIFVLSNCVAPNWLRPDDPRLVWVDHVAVIPTEYLPTFNSHVIESFLHRIPELADNFIYFNDDVFAMRTMAPSDFYSPQGASCSWLEPYGMVSGRPKSGDADYLNASRNSAAIILKQFGFVPTRLHLHVPFALRKPVLEEIEITFSTRLREFRVNRFRQINDLNITSFFYHYYALATQNAVIASCVSMMIKSNDVRWLAKLNQAKAKPLDFLCINEGGAGAASPRWHAKMKKFMEETFSQKADWEQ